MSGIVNLDLDVEYIDGTSERVHGAQADIAAFERWAVTKGLFAPEGRMLMDVARVLFLQYVAYVATARASDARLPAFEAWQKTIVAVVAAQAVEADPTPLATSDEPSPPSPSDSE